MLPDCFQGSYKKEVVQEEEGIPTGQKQGGGDSGAFQTAIGDLPGVEFDKSTSLPTIPELGVTDNTEKNTKTHDSANAGEPPVALKGSMTIGQGSLSSGQKQSHGAQVRDTTLVAKEGTECCPKCGKPVHEGACAVKKEETTYVNKKVAKIMSYREVGLDKS